MPLPWDYCPLIRLDSFLHISRFRSLSPRPSCPFPVVAAAVCARPARPAYHSFTDALGGHLRGSLAWRCCPFGSVSPSHSWVWSLLSGSLPSCALLRRVTWAVVPVVGVSCLSSSSSCSIPTRGRFLDRPLSIQFGLLPYNMPQHMHSVSLSPVACSCFGVSPAPARYLPLRPISLVLLPFLVSPRLYPCPLFSVFVSRVSRFVGARLCLPCSSLVALFPLRIPTMYVRDWSFLRLCGARVSVSALEAFGPCFVDIGFLRESSKSLVSVMEVAVWQGAVSVMALAPPRWWRAPGGHRPLHSACPRDACSVSGVSMQSHSLPPL